MYEAEDYNCVLRWHGDGCFPHTRVQLKEVVPHLNPKASIAAELAKYTQTIPPGQPRGVSPT